jgi:sulfofructosephosphate aldolase
MSSLDALARESGTFLMVAMDQRESLRTMLEPYREDPVEDAELVRFKLAVARELGPLASGFLVDRRLGFEEIVRDRLLPATCGLVLAADVLDQQPGGLVEDTDLDESLDLGGLASVGVVALKLLVIWRPDGDDERRLALARRFVAMAAEQGLASILEGVVRPVRDVENGFDREAQILECARQLGSVEPSLYKVEVPLHGRAAPDELERRCAEIDAVLPCPWVVLSSGVEPADFPAAVEAACKAGASGMLAGRAVWRVALPPEDPTPLLRQHSAPLLRRLAAILDRHGRPWRDR